MFSNQSTTMTIGPTMISSATGRMTTSTVILNALNGIVKKHSSL